MEPPLLIPREKAVVVVDLRALRLVVVRHVTALPAGFSAEGMKVLERRISIDIALKRREIHSQALFHPERLRVVFDVDDVLPLALRRLPPLRLGVHDLCKQSQL